MKLAFFSSALPGAALAQTASDVNLIVTGTRASGGLPAALSGGSLTVIDSQALLDHQVRVVSDVLRDVPGLAVSRSGPAGGLTQVRIRGAEANHTLVLIDGIEASDPFQGEFDFASLIADDVARIEVLHGQQSALYGSDAIGGVINYVTASGAERPGASLRIDHGSFDTSSGAARLAGVDGDLDYALSGAFLHSDGTPGARRGIGSRRLEAENRTLSARLAYTPAPNLKLTAILRHFDAEADTDGQDFDYTSPTYGFVIDTQDRTRSRGYHGLLRAEASLLDGRWTHALAAQLTDVHRTSLTADDVVSRSRGERTKLSYDTTFRVDAGVLRHRLTAAVDVERERFRSLPVGMATPANAPRHIDTLGVVGEYDLSVGDHLALGAAIRHDRNDHFRNASTYRVHAAVMPVTGLTLRAATGSGIKNPTNYELFGYDPGMFIGNPALRPEKSRGWEAGADLGLGGDATLGITLFRSHLVDEVFTLYLSDFTATPDNRDSRSTQNGIELALAARLGRDWRVDGSYTYLRAREDGVTEVRRPANIASLNLGWRPAAGPAGATLTIRYNGSMIDSNFTNAVATPTVQLDSFTLVNLSADWRVAKHVVLFGRVENLLNSDYEEVFTYRSPGRSAAAGVRMTL